MRVSQSGSNPAANSEVSRAGKLDRTTQSKNAKKVDKTEQAEGGDASASISGKAKEFAKAKAAAAQAPEVREEKIAELRKRIASGKYHVDENAIADRMVDEEISMHGIG